MLTSHQRNDSILFISSHVVMAKEWGRSAFHADQDITKTKDPTTPSFAVGRVLPVLNKRISSPSAQQQKTPNAVPVPAGEKTYCYNLGVSSPAD